MASLLCHKNSVYGFSYLSERFLEQPFFLGVNGLSGELVGESWTFSSNPALCSRYVCDNHKLEDTLVYFMHVINHNYIRNYLPNETFDKVMSVMSDILEKIEAVIDLVNSNIDLDIVMTAYNLIFLFNKVVHESYCSLIAEQSIIGKLQQNYRAIGVFLYTTCEYILNNDENPNKALKTLVTISFNLKCTLHAAIEIAKHKDLKSLKTEIVTGSNDLKFNEMSNDFLFKRKVEQVIIEEDIIKVTHCRSSTFINFDKLKNELSNRDTHLKIFEFIDVNSVIDSNTLNYHKKLQQCLRDSVLSINMEEFRKMTMDFTKKFWKRRSKRTEQDECILFEPEETEFVFQFTTLGLEYLKRVPKDDTEFRKIVQENFTEFGKILNSLRYMEIYNRITLKTAVILSKTLEELVTDPSVLKFIKEMPSLIMNVTTKITYFVGMIKNIKENIIIRDEQNVASFSLTEAKSIEDLFQISKIRKSKWKKAFGDGTTLDNCDQFYNRDTCPVCLDEQKRDHCCFLICKHTICSSCTEKIIDSNKIPRCPVCRYPLSEFLPSVKLADICRALQ